MTIFRKLLKKTDVKDRLSFPTKSLKKLPSFGKEHAIDVPVKDRNGHIWKVRCNTRKKMSRDKAGKAYMKPVLSGEWHSFAASKDLQVGDEIKFFQEIGQSDDGNLHYRVEVKTKINNFMLFGVNITESVTVL